MFGPHYALSHTVLIGLKEQGRLSQYFHPFFLTGIEINTNTESISHEPCKLRPAAPPTITSESKIHFPFLLINVLMLSQTLLNVND